MSGLFESLGRGLVCVDSDFRIIHASAGLDAMVGPGTVAALTGAPIEQVLGPELFGQEGSLRRALIAGERREGWGTSLRAGEGRERMVSLSAAPVTGVDSPLCDPRVAYLIVVRPDDLGATGESGPVRFAGMVARSRAMQRIFTLVQNLAESDATVLITGESGTGKELVARALHSYSPRGQGPFVALNCGAIPSELLESELFGHVRGAFTGAIRDRQGRFELAHRGALFLDEVADLPLSLQVKLLRVLQERSFERLGESRTRRSDARIIAATNRDPKREVAAGRFREDLFYRLRVVPIHVPPLRERREDIEPLARHLLARVMERQGRSLLLAPDALRALIDYSWPGNVRELENALEYAMAVCRGQTIHAADLPAETRDGPEPLADAPAGEPTAALHERERVVRALETHRWNRERAAAALGMSRTTLWRKMRELGLV